MSPDAIMVFAAGFGKRMGALTKDCPKPMIEVSGRPLIDHTLELVHQAGVEKIVVNTHYKAEVLETHLAPRTDVKLLREYPEIFETGGGLRNALPLLGDAPVYTLNSDMVWTGDNPLQALARAWDPSRMDALLMVVPREKAQENRGAGDFFMDRLGRLSRRGELETAPFVYSGTQIIKTNRLMDFEQNSFSLNLVWDEMLRDQRVFGIVHSGGWVDVGRPEGIAVAEAELKRAENV